VASWIASLAECCLPASAGLDRKYVLSDLPLAISIPEEDTAAAPRESFLKNSRLDFVF
jgi:hypothetical protein